MITMTQEIPDHEFNLSDAFMALQAHHKYLAARKYLTEQDKALLAVYPQILRSVHDGWTSQYWRINVPGSTITT